jgi:hypothetical protein
VCSVAFAISIVLNVSSALWRYITKKTTMWEMHPTMTRFRWVFRVHPVASSLPDV